MEKIKICTICEEKPRVGKKLRCARCWSYKYRHGVERPREGVRVGQGQKGREFTPEHRAKMSAAQQRNAERARLEGG